jgi:RNA polymerase sigma-70 factor (ECF subfamily)
MDAGQQPHGGSTSTLGDVLYTSKSTAPIAEREWVELVRSIAAGDQLALHALYERTHRIVFTLIMRIIGNREIADELTLDVFTDIWRRASDYDAAAGTVVGWVMNQARHRAINRLRLEQSEHFRAALTVLTPDERQAIETAFFCELTYAEAAERLDRPLNSVRTDIHSGLQKLRQALARETDDLQR